LRMLTGATLFFFLFYLFYLLKSMDEAVFEVSYVISFQCYGSAICSQDALCV
jgi:hypothetical protein